MRKLVLGIDGGATKGHLALFDENGNCAGVSVSGPLNHENMKGSFDELKTKLSGFIMSALAAVGGSAGTGDGSADMGDGSAVAGGSGSGSDCAVAGGSSGAGIGDIAYAVLGLGGVDTTAQHATISEILRSIGIQRFYLCNDAYLGVAAGCPGGVGICAINGTGTSMAAVDHSGNALQVAGVGYITDDRGGSGWYGRQILGAVYNSLYKGGEQTMLKDMIFSLLGVTHKEDYIDKLTTALGNGTVTIHTFNRLAFEAAGAGDKVAVSVLDYSAEHFAGGIAYIAGNMDFPADKALNVTFAGSVFTKEKTNVLPKLIDARVRALLGSRAVEYFTLDTAPVAGSVLWAAQKAGFEYDMAKIKPALAEAGLR